MNDQERYDIGLSKRRSTVGEAYVEKTLQALNSVNEDFQSLVTRYVWGEVWSRPGIEEPTRRLLTLTMLIALNRNDEFELHVRSALEHGLDIELLKEMVLQVAIYAGIPAANTAMRILCRVAEDLAIV